MLVRLKRSFGFVSCLAMLGAGCNLSLDAKGDVDDAIDKLPDVDDLTNIKICGDETLQDLLKADGLSDDCRNKVESFLPDPQSSFESRIAVLDDSLEPTTGARTVYFVAADAQGNAIYPSSASELTVSVMVEGSAKILVEGEFSFELPQTGNLLSLAVVNDYSASMRDADLDDVAEIEHDLFTYLPPIYESEVYQFSEMVSLKQDFTVDENALLSAVAKDPTYNRQSTALYDGMGAALDTLRPRTPPIQVLLVSTDGQENASTMVMEPELLSEITDSKVFVIMLGALFADVPELKRLAGDRGIYVYARGYGRLKSAVKGLLESFQHVGALHLPPQYAKGPVTVSFAGQTITLQ
ncbi:MAG: vWA domain-containing protein [Myxococcales bacterium]